MRVIGLVGMPGSGKSKVMKQREAEGFKIFDDLYKDNGRQVPDLRKAIAAKENVIFSDIQFCVDSNRAAFEQQFRIPIEWVFYANNPYQCALNVLYRFFVEGKKRDWATEMRFIHDHTSRYRPSGNILEVIKTPLPSHEQYLPAEPLVGGHEHQGG